MNRSIMSRDELVRIDATGAAPRRQACEPAAPRAPGAFRLMPAPAHLIVMRYVGEDGKRDDDDGPVVRLAGEITAPGTLCDIVALVGQAGWKGELVVLERRDVAFNLLRAGNVIARADQRRGRAHRRGALPLGALTEEQVEVDARVARPKGGASARPRSSSGSSRARSSSS